MAFVRLLKDLMRDKDFGHRIVPIIPDEARTFGMDAFFPTREDLQPERPELHVGRPRAAARLQGEPSTARSCTSASTRPASWRRSPAVGTSYATHGEPLIPVYVFYSMFGFQRTGDAIWAAGDQMARGFIIGATAGRTTLTGEGLQHADGHSPLLAVDQPGGRALRPGVRLRDRRTSCGRPRPHVRRRLATATANVMYYLTVYNEPIVQPAEPEDVDVEGILRGIHLLAEGSPRADGARGRSCSRPASACRGRSRRSSCSRNDWGVVGRRLVGHVVERAAPRRPRRRRAQLPPPRRRGAACRTSRRSCRAPRARSSRCPTTCTPCQDQIRAVGARATSRRSAPTASASPTPARPPGASSRSTARRWWCARCSSLAERGEVDRSVPLEAIERYRLYDVTAGTSGNAGGDS